MESRTKLNKWAKNQSGLCRRAAKFEWRMQPSTASNSELLQCHWKPLYGAFLLRQLVMAISCNKYRISHTINRKLWKRNIISGMHEFIKIYREHMRTCSWIFVYQLEIVSRPAYGNPSKELSYSMCSNYIRASASTFCITVGRV